MKLRKIRWSAGLAACFAAVLGVAGIVLLVRPKALVHATPDTESAFLQHYSPETVVKPFFSKTRPEFSLLEHDGTTDGEKSAIHDKDAELHIVIEREKWLPLMESVAADLSAQLKARGADVQDVSGDPRAGFRYQYMSGNTIGSAIIEPLAIPDPVRTLRATPLCPQDTDARLRVKIHEEWFKVKPTLMTLRVEGHIH